MKKILALSVLAAGSLAICFSGAAMAKDTYGTVRTLYNSPSDGTRTFTGECRENQWSFLFDPCAQPTPPEPKPLMAAVPAFRTVVRKEMRTVHFDFDDDALTPSAKQQLNQLASTLKGAKDIRGAEIIGHADKMGDDSHNLGLSERRAKAVEAYLNSQGYLNTSLTQVRGVGSSAAIMSCEKHASLEQRVACNSEDRKTDIKVIYSQDELVQ